MISLWVEMVRGPIYGMVWNIEMCIRDQNTGIDTIEYVSLIPWVCNENCKMGRKNKIEAEVPTLVGWGKVPKIDYIWTSKYKNKLQHITISQQFPFSHILA